MRISVFGIGYVGVVSCGCLVELGHEVIGVDVSAEKIAMLAAGRSPIVEEAIDDAVEIGYDGYTIDGKYPQNAMWGIEIKDAESRPTCIARLTIAVVPRRTSA